MKRLIACEWVQVLLIVIASVVLMAAMCIVMQMVWEIIWAFRCSAALGG